MANPYSLVFGMEPPQMIARAMQESIVLDTFTTEKPGNYIYMITGVRGAGKTVFLTDISKRLAKEKNWITIELSPEKDMLTQLASRLTSINTFARMFRSAGINLSFFGLGVQMKDISPITDIETALQRMLSTLKEKGMRLLITVDEVTNTPWVREFASAYQILLRNDLPVFLLMTGLYENIGELQDEKNLTFLYRAPKMEMAPLNIGAMARNYKIRLNVDEETALSMARLTNGYSYAFQLLGYFTWENGGDYKKAMDSYRQYLDEYVYDKIWSELSPKDQKILYGIATSTSSVVQDIRRTLKMETNEWNPYRRRLIRKGLIDGSNRGKVTFTLPQFNEYIKENYYE